MKAIQAPVEDVVGQKFYVGCGEEITVEDLAVMCRDAASGGVPIEYVGYRPGEEEQREAFSADKASKVLGYRARVTAAEAIRLTAEWVRGLPESFQGKWSCPSRLHIRSPHR